MRRPSLLLPLVALFLLTGLTQCHRGPESGDGRSPTVVFQPKQDHLGQAMELLKGLDEFDPQKGMGQAAYQLNRWSDGYESPVVWQPDALLREMPRDLREMPLLQRLDKPQFTTADVRYLQEASWARSISDRLAVQMPAANDQAWLAELEQTRGEPHAYKVGLGARLFDWTIRNLQLDALLPYPGFTAGPNSGDEAKQPSGSPLDQAIPGPGYTQFPWETLLFGRGDEWQRARVFILLCRQQQLPCVMLAFDDPQASPRPRPWLPALLVDDQLYLFDTQLGLPIPGPDGRGIATLAQVLEDRGLLSDLAVGEDHPYPAADADFAELVVAIDASPEALSLRMRQLEEAASATDPLVLSVQPDALAERLHRLPGIQRVELWQTPFEAWRYHDAVRRLATPERPQLLAQQRFEEWLFGRTHPLVLGRIQYFRGQYEATSDSPGAKGYYREARVPDAKLDQLETSPAVQQEMGIFRQRENDAEWAARLRSERIVWIGIKQTANYWMGLVHEATGRYDAAIDWLRNRTLDDSDSNLWRSGARYNLARIYTAQGKLAEARRLLLLDDSPQTHGSLLMARFLRERMAAESGQEDAPAAEE